MSSTASSSDETRHRIVRSLFSRKAEDGTLEETLVTYLRVKEDDGHGNAKSRYLMLAGGYGREVRRGVREERVWARDCRSEDERGLAKRAPANSTVTRLGECMLHKGKSNTNGTFSRGKTWRLSDMRALEQIGVSLLASLDTSRSSLTPASRLRPHDDDQTIPLEYRFVAGSACVLILAA